jgi:hypothetical protein
MPECDFTGNILNEATKPLSNNLREATRQQVSGERGPLESRSRPGRVDPVERSDLGGGENAVGRGVWLGARRHSDEEYAPADHRDEARNFASLSAVSSLASSARQPDFMTLWNTSASYLNVDLLPKLKCSSARGK